MKIFETLDRDPRFVSLANNGQARIDGAAAELRAELETFVCEGQFSDAIQRILESYFTNLTNPRQKLGMGERFLWERQVPSAQDAGTPLGEHPVPGRVNCQKPCARRPSERN